MYRKMYLFEVKNAFDHVLKTKNGEYLAYNLSDLLEILGIYNGVEDQFLYNAIVELIESGKTTLYDYVYTLTEQEFKAEAITALKQEAKEIKKNLNNKKRRNKKMRKYYVTMTDKFMSGWGLAKGKTNKVVIECNSYEEAETVAENARSRSEMSRVNIAANMPYYNKDEYLISFRTISDWPKWFEEDAFKEVKRGF